MSKLPPPSIEFKYRWVGPAYRCCYCGDLGGDVDHTVPRSHVRENIRAYRRNWFPKVSACRECNSVLGSKVDATFRDRKTRVAAALRRRHAKVLRASGWDASETRQLGYALRTKIEGAMLAGQKAAARIAFAEIWSTAGVPDDLFGQFLTPAEEREHADLIAKITA